MASSDHGPEEFHSPYKLQIIINGAENLPIADYTTSDPYVSIYVGGRFQGRTKTVYRNRSPAWNEVFNIKLLHRKSSIMLKIWDDDRGKNDDLMGTVTIDLSTIPLDKQEYINCAVDPAGSFVTKASKLELHILVRTNSSVIKIVKDNPSPHCDKILGQLIDTVASIAQVLPAAKVSESILNALTRFMSAERIDFFHYELIKDLLWDVSTLYKPISAQDKELYNQHLKAAMYSRTELRLVNAQRILFESGTALRHPPIEENALQLNLCINESLFVLLHYSNRLAMWVGARWLRVLYDVWKGRIRRADVPFWAQNGVYAPSCTGLQLSDGRSFSANSRIIMSLDRKFVLSVDDECIPVNSMCDMVLSLDSVVPRAYLMDIEVLNYSVTGDYSEDQRKQLEEERQVDQALAAAKVEDIAQGSGDFDPGDHIGGGRLLRKFRERKHSVFYSVGKGIQGTLHGAVKGVTSVASGTAQVASSAGQVAVGTISTVGQVAVGTISNVASGTVHTASNLATGDIRAVTRNIASGIQTAPNHLFGERATYLMLKSSYISQRVENASSDSRRHFYVDWDAHDMMSRTPLLRDRRLEARPPASRQPDAPEIFSSGAAEQDRRARYRECEEEEECYKTYPTHDSSKSGVMVLLCHGVESLEAISGHRRLSAQMLSQKLDTVSEVPLNSKLGFCVTLNEAKGLDLRLPGSESNNLLPSIGRGGVFAKMRLVDMHGHSGGGAIRQSEAIKSPSFTPAPKVAFSDFSVIFQAKDGIEHAEFVRVEIVLEDLTATALLGAALIPLEYFQLKQQTFTFPLARCHRVAMTPRPEYVRHPLGELTVTLHRIEELDESRATMAVRPLLTEVNIFNTRWMTEAVLAGAVDCLKSHKTGRMDNVERVTLLPALAGLELLEIEDAVAKKNKERNSFFNRQGGGGKHGRGSVGAASAAAAADFLVDEYLDEAAAAGITAAGSGKAGKGGRADAMEMDIEIYENQRRQPYPPFDWSSNAYTRPQYSDLDFGTTYKFEALEKAKAPLGFQWANSWRVDKSYTETDDNGWSYGFTFGKLLSNYKAGKPSQVRPVNMHARRRKWVRKAVAVDFDASVLDLKQTMHYFTKQAEPADYEKKRRTSSGTGPVAGGAVAGFGAGASPGSVSGPTWRRMVADGRSVLKVCQEKAEDGGPILIPWDQVMSVNLVSSSVLAIYIKVSRYFREVGGVVSFKPADMELFVSNCPAVQLKSLIEERMWFHNIQGNIRRVIQSGTATGHLNGESRATSLALSVLSEDTADVPETEQLSMGSEIVADLDDNSIMLETRISELDALYRKHDDEQVLAEKAVLLRRDCRLRLYTAALLGVGLQGNHDFTEGAVKRIMLNDLQRATRITQDTEVLTANNRIEFVLDTAEKRIRDAVLCGWQHRGSGDGEKGKLERCIEIFSNGYFIEIVGLLGSYFEEQGQQDVKGLGSKVELLNTYMRHNDRLACIIDNALRPYALKADPPAKLSLFLDFDILASWYTNALVLEMRGRVDATFEAWHRMKTEDKETGPRGGLAQLYKFPLPWLPQRVETDEGHFFSAIPEDLVEVLFTYLQYAVLRRSAVAPSFQQHISKLESEVCLSYTTTFLYLCEKYSAALNSKDWAGAADVDGEELVENSTWLSSVVNDAYRVLQRKLHEAVRVNETKRQSVLDLTSGGDGGDGTSGDNHPPEMSEKQAKRERDMTRRAEAAFTDMAELAVDHLASIQFRCLMHEREQLLTEALPELWRAAQVAENSTSSSAAAAAQSVQLISDLTEGLTEYITEKYAFLDKSGYKELVYNCADKLIVLYLSMLRLAGEQAFTLTQLEINQVAKDVTDMEMCFSKAVVNNFSASERKEMMDRIEDKFSILSVVVELLGLDVMQMQVAVATLDKVAQLAKNIPSDAFALSKLSETCFALQGIRMSAHSDCRHTKKHVDDQQRLAKHPGTPVGKPTTQQGQGQGPDSNRSAHRHSFFGGLFHSHEDSHFKSKDSSFGGMTGGGAASRSSSSAAGATAALAAMDLVAAGAGNDSDDELVEDADMKEMRQAKLDAYISCVKVMLDSIKEQSRKAAEEREARAGKRRQHHRDSDVKNLLSLNPLRRVFGQEEVFGHADTFSLEEMLLKPALTQRSGAVGTGKKKNDHARDRRKAGAGGADDADGGGGGGGGFFSRTLHGLFSGGKKGKGQEANDAFVAQIKQLDSAGANDPVRSNLMRDAAAGAESGSDWHLSLSTADSLASGRGHQQYLVLYGLRAVSLFYLDIFSSPNVYLLIRLGSAFVTKTKVVDMQTDTFSADWTEEAPRPAGAFGSAVAAASTAASASISASSAPSSAPTLPPALGSSSMTAHEGRGDQDASSVPQALLDGGAVYIPLSANLAAMSADTLPPAPTSAPANTSSSNSNSASAAAGVSGSSSSSSLAQLSITLCYEGFLRDHIIGTVTIPFAPYAPPKFEQKQLPLSDFSHSAQALHAAEKAREEGRSLPAIVLSAAPYTASGLLLA